MYSGGFPLPSAELKWFTPFGELPIKAKGFTYPG
jgi:hypothetical protein